MIKAVIKFFRKENVQIVMIAICLFVMLIGLIAAFVVIAFPKDDEMEKMIRQTEIRKEKEAKWYRELKERNGWD